MILTLSEFYKKNIKKIFQIKITLFKLLSKINSYKKIVRTYINKVI